MSKSSHKKTTGKLSTETVISFNNKPKALQQGFASDSFDLRSQNLIIIIGGIKFISTQILIQIEDEPILSIHRGDDNDEPFLLSARLRGDNGEVIMEIERNEWKSPSTQWDCKSEGNRIEIRSAPRHIELVIRQEPPNFLFIDRLQMSHQGCKIEAFGESGTKFISSEGIEVNFKGGMVFNYSLGFCLHKAGHITLGDGKGNGFVSNFQMNVKIPNDKERLQAFLKKMALKS